MSLLSKPPYVWRLGVAKCPMLFPAGSNSVGADPSIGKIFQTLKTSRTLCQSGYAFESGAGSRQADPVKAAAQALAAPVKAAIRAIASNINKTG